MRSRDDRRGGPEIYTSMRPKDVSAEAAEKVWPSLPRQVRDQNRREYCAVSVHWRGEPDEALILGKPLVTGTAGDGLWFFQTHHDE